MDVTYFTQFLIFTLTYHVLSAYITSSPVPVLAKEGCQLCPHKESKCLPRNITVQIFSKNNCSTDVKMSCDTNLPPNLIRGFEWQKEQKKLASKNKSTLVQKIRSQKEIFTCTVLSPCGNFNSSSYKIVCHENPTLTFLLICGVGAILVILVFGITMKIMLKRGEVQRQARRQQRRAMQSNNSDVTVISY